MRELNLSHADRVAIDQELCRRSLGAFVRKAWRVLEPESPLRWGWALDATAEHLEAVTTGQIKRLLINVPPGMMKSLMCGVFWPAWEWGPKGKPAMRFMGTAHKFDLAVRDSAKMKTLIKSPWYQARWGIPLKKDSDIKFENTMTGFREAMAFNSLTGSRGDRVLLDDPLSVEDANSEVELHKAALRFTEALPSRVNNDESAIVVIMQRLHDMDTSGIILKNNLPYEHLMLPMEFEPERKCYTSIGFEDPRKEPGELLMPERFSAAAVEDLKRTLSVVGGSYAVAGQLQQRPVPRGGGLFKEEWLQTRLPTRPKCRRWVRAYDLAGSTTKKSPYTVGALMGIMEDGRICLADIRRYRKTPGMVTLEIKNTAKTDSRRVHINLPQDPGQAGKAQVEFLAKELQGHIVKWSPESGDKETRAMPLASQAEAGNLVLVEGNWIKDFVDEATTFPMGQFKDQIDACSRAYAYLVGEARATWKGTL